MTDRELIEKLKEEYDVKGIKELSEITKIALPTLSKWYSTGKISTSGTGRLYLELMLKCRAQEKELEYVNSMRDVLRSFICGKEGESNE